MNSLVSRRRFLGQMNCAAVTAAPLLSTLFSLKGSAAAANASSQNDYKALVCIFLGGGNDSYNMLLPYESSAYAGYQRARSNLAIPRESVLPLSNAGTNPELALHPGMPELRDLYQSGTLGFVTNVGTLVEPTTLAAYENDSARLPMGLYSHADQIMHWQTSVPDSRSAFGWAGRLADLMRDANRDAAVSMNISLSGTNTFQAGRSTSSYEITPFGNGAVTLEPYSDHPALSAISKTAVNSMMDATYKNIFESAFAETTKRAIDSSETVANAINATSLQTVFSPSELSQSLAMIARTIAARDTLCAKRQTFFVMFGGWDHHGELINNHAAMLPVVSKALSEFYQATVELGVDQKVTTFTASDFARTLSSNGRGSDHAWGGNQIVLGGAVKGGQIYGQYPDLAPRSNLDTGRGRLIPTLSTDEYFAELAMWFGVQPSDLSAVLPNLGRFYSTGSESPIGILA